MFAEALLLVSIAVEHLEPAVYSNEYCHRMCSYRAEIPNRTRTIPMPTTGTVHATGGCVGEARGESRSSLVRATARESREKQVTITSSPLIKTYLEGVGDFLLAQFQRCQRIMTSRQVATVGINHDSRLETIDG